MEEVRKEVICRLFEFTGAVTFKSCNDMINCLETENTFKDSTKKEIEENIKSIDILKDFKSKCTE